MYQHHTAPQNPQHPVYSGGFVETPYHGNRPPNGAALESSQWAPTQTDYGASQWAPTADYVGHQVYGQNPPPSVNAESVEFGGPRLGFPYAFDPSVPPPPFSCPPPPGHFPNTVPPGPGNSFCSPTQLGVAPHPRYDEFQSVSDYGEKRHEEYGSVYGAPPSFPPPGQNHDRRPATAPTDDEASSQRRRDKEWVTRFLQSRTKPSKSPHTQNEQRPPNTSIPAFREALYGAADLIRALEESCETLNENMADESVWTDSYSTALNLKKQLQEKLNLLSDEESLKALKAKLDRIGKRRAQKIRARSRLQQQMEQKQLDISEKEAAIDAWLMKKRHEVEEKKKEQELKLAADSVLCEVRKKQADLKRMHGILRSLEKLRKLRKEAASRKGITTEQECDQTFSGRLERLRVVLKGRTAIYSAEEKALMVMLEGEQEEERRREREKRMKKERERQLQRKRKVNAMLFGDELPVDHVMQPYRDYYGQAEHSLPALIQISPHTLSAFNFRIRVVGDLYLFPPEIHRRDWDAFLVAADHPNGTLMPQGWIIPDPPSDQNWASALQTDDDD